MFICGYSRTRLITETVKVYKVRAVIRMASSVPKVEVLPPLSEKPAVLPPLSEKPAVLPPLSEKPAVPKHQFYRRPLPASCISFASEEGKKIFAEALSTGHMNCFFKLCSQYRTQDEPAYCGLTSLVMALNVLEIDPGRIWKGPWRWYHEDMLDCCTPLQVAREKGINMEQFSCLARCNNLTATAKSASSISSVDELRAEIKDATQREDVVFIASYSRKILGQTGDGHFSPIAGYHEGRDLALILDTARFKYPPHWIPVPLLLEAMRPLDPDTGRSRGFVLLSSAGSQPGLLLFRPSCVFAVDTKKGRLNAQLLDFAREWGQWLSSKFALPIEPKALIHQALSFLADMMARSHTAVSIFCLTLPFLRANNGLPSYLVECPQSSKGLKEVNCAVRKLMAELETLETFKMAREFLRTKSAQEKERFLNLIQAGQSCTKEHAPGEETSTCCKTNCCNRTSVDASKVARLDTDLFQGCDNCEGVLKLGPEHAVTLFLSTWPHTTSITGNLSLTSDTNSNTLNSCNSANAGGTAQRAVSTNVIGQLLVDVISSDINQSGLDHIKAEIGTIKFKLREVIKYHSPGLASYCCGGS